MGDDRSEGGGLRAEVPAIRPIITAVAEAQPIPMLILGDDGTVLTCGTAARRLCTTEGGRMRLVAQDGTDLWTIVSARRDEARPVFDIRVRLRAADGQTVDSTLTVAPLMGPGATLGGAAVYVTSIPAERRLGPYEDSRAVPRDSSPYAAFDEIVGRLGELAGADFTCLAEVDPDDPGQAWLLAAWERDGDARPTPESAATLGSVLASVIKGRRFMCMPEGVKDALSANPWLAHRGYDAYIGGALVGPGGQHLGILVALWRTAPADLAGTCAILSILSSRATTVLGRLVAERELKESEQRYGAVFEGSSMPILLIEPTTTQILDANPAACDFYGYDRDEIVTMSVLQLDALPTETVQAEFVRAVEGTRPRFKSRHRAADGTAHDVEVSTGSIVVGGRRVLYAMINDITERLRMEAALERHQRNLEQVVSQRTQDLLRANAELQHATVARDMIFASLTQEVRTSLQTITGFSELMLGGMAGDLTDEQERQTRMVLEAGKRLSAFVDSLIESSRYDDADLTCEPEEFDLVELIESMVFGLDSFAAGKGLTVTMVAEERPLPVETDRYKLQKVLLNLLSNAIRYTEQGGVTVTVGRPADDMCAITVADTGEGIDPARLKTLFEGPELHEPAAGIGLPASRRIAEAIGATIDVVSVRGKGSIFTLRLPMRCTAAPSVAAGENDVSAGGPE